MSEPFETIAIEASQCQVIGHTLAAVFGSDYMIGFMRKEGLFFREQTIFAASFGPFSYLFPQRWRDTGRTHGWLPM